MMRNLTQRVLLIAAVTLLAAACGTLAGYRLAHEIAVRTAESWLDQYAGRLMADGEASSAELRTTLAAVSASQYRSCSHAEIDYFRTLIFESEYLKDAGRMRDGRILCSAALAPTAVPQRQFKPDYTQQDGTVLFKDLAPYRNADLTVLTLQLGDFYVAFTPYTRMHLEALPMHFAETATDAPTQRTGRLLGESPAADVPLFTTDGQTRVGEALYATRCSIRFFDCVTAYTSIPEVVAVNRGKFTGCVVLCGLVGALFGLAFSLLYRRNKSTEQQLRRAIRSDKLRVVYQPIVELPSGRIVGAEALVRWIDEDGKTVGPDVFVRMAEERGFVGEITRLVLRHVLRDFGATLRNRPEFRVSINVAAADLSDPEFLPMLDRSLEQAAVPARSLAIEITESSTANYQVAIETILRLRHRGHSVHIDDFGTGYSSLSYLLYLNVDCIKVDQAFTKAIGTESVTVAILPQILAMAEALKLGVVAEGVENEKQANYFSGAAREIHGQGWLFGRPVAFQEFIQLLEEQRLKERAKAGSLSSMSKAELIQVPQRITA